MSTSTSDQEKSTIIKEEKNSFHLAIVILLHPLEHMLVIGGNSIILNSITVHLITATH